MSSSVLSELHLLTPMLYTLYLTHVCLVDEKPGQRLTICRRTHIRPCTHDFVTKSTSCFVAILRRRWLLFSQFLCNVAQTIVSVACTLRQLFVCAKCTTAIDVCLFIDNAISMGKYGSFCAQSIACNDYALCYGATV